MERSPHITPSTRDAACFLDIGNSRIKLARLVADSSGDTVSWEMSASWDRYDKHAIKELAAHLDNESAVTGVSVVSELRQELDSLTQNRVDWVESVQIPSNRSLYGDARALGTDRFLLADAAWRASGSLKNVIVIGAGTACTIDLMNRLGIHQGGAILPGIRTLQRSFELCMPGLPGVEVSIPDQWPGRSTQEGIQWGQAGMLRAALQEFMQESIRYFGEEIDVYISGGDAEVVNDLLESVPAGIGSVIRDPWLLFKGLQTSDTWRVR